MAGLITSTIVNSPAHLGANFWYGYGNLRFVASSRTLSPFWKVACFPAVCLTIAIAACACEAVVFS